jgi:hypothetical protein
MLETLVMIHSAERVDQAELRSMAEDGDDQLIDLERATQLGTPLGLALRAALRVAILELERLRASSACFRDSVLSAFADLCFTS